MQRAFFPIETVTGTATPKVMKNPRNTLQCMQQTLRQCRTKRTTSSVSRKRGYSHRPGSIPIVRSDLVTTELTNDVQKLVQDVITSTVSSSRSRKVLNRNIESYVSSLGSILTPNNHQQQKQQQPPTTHYNSNTVTFHHPLGTNLTQSVPMRQSMQPIGHARNDYPFYQSFMSGNEVKQSTIPNLHSNNTRTNEVDTHQLRKDLVSNVSHSLPSSCIIRNSNSIRSPSNINTNNSNITFTQQRHRSSTIPTTALYHQPTQRWHSTNNGNNNNGTNKGNDPNTIAKATKPEPNEEESLSMSRLTAAINAQMLEERFKHIVYDQLPGIMVAIITVLLLAAPYAIQQMKKNDHPSSAADLSIDPIDDFIKLARHEWDSFDDTGDGTDAESDETNQTKNLLQAVLLDVFSSRNLQEAAQQFVIQILTSDAFKTTVTGLVRELWNDLITDPETIAQVIKVLELAIQDPAIKDAAKQLVLQIVDDPVVKESIIKLIQKLGDEPLVRQAVVDLLTESAHTTLSDPDVLDHSMEFATDVVGDDIVQRTAGEALRNTVGHAFMKPASTVLLTSLGVSLLIFGAISVGYSRSTEQEAALMEHAARSLKSNTTYGIHRIITWPVRNSKAVFSYISNKLVLPIIYSTVQLLSDTTSNIYTTISSALSYIVIDIPSSILLSIQNSIYFCVTSLLNVPRNLQKGMLHMIYNMFDTIQQGIVRIVTSGQAFVASLIAQITTTLASTSQSIQQSLLEILHDIWTNWIVQTFQVYEKLFLQYIYTIELSIRGIGLDNEAQVGSTRLNKIVQAILDTGDDYVIQLYYKLQAGLSEFLQQYRTVDEAA